MRNQHDKEPSDRQKLIDALNNAYVEYVDFKRRPDEFAVREGGIDNRSRELSLRVGRLSVFAFYAKPGLGWFRVFGVGLHWKDTSRHGMYFSERTRRRKFIRIGSWLIRFLSYRST